MCNTTAPFLAPFLFIGKYLEDCSIFKIENRAKRGDILLSSPIRNWQSAFA